MNEAYKRRIEARFLVVSARTELAPFFEHVKKLQELSFEEKEFLVDQFRWADQKQNFPELWSTEAVTMGCHILGNVAHYAECGMFIIRLYGVLNDFPALFGKIYGDVTKVFKNNAHLETIQTLDENILRQVAALKGCFTEIELLAIEFLRNQQAHVFPTKYQISRRSDGTFKRAITNELPIVARIDEVLEYLKPYNADPRLYAAFLAERSLSCLEKIREAVESRGKLAFSIV